jgi:hypothetical protein
MATISKAAVIPIVAHGVHDPLRSGSSTSLVRTKETTKGMEKDGGCLRQKKNTTFVVFF